MYPETLCTVSGKIPGQLLKVALALIFLAAAPSTGSTQEVKEIITDYNGYWKSGISSINPVRPDNHHNLLAFTYNNTTYSTGVNNSLLTANGQAYTPELFIALPMQNFNGALTSNTKIGLGAMVDGVLNGAGAAPSRSLGQYLNDGTNGLDMGTCVANLPAGTMYFPVNNIQSVKIGDGVPDILVTQIADPSTSFDSYEFTDVNGTRIGNSLNVVLNNISPVGNWVADFYEATGSSILTAGFTQTPRAIRLWAADFTSFGLNASNIGGIAYFKINLSGTSDIAFVAYNSTTISVQVVLDLASEQAKRQRLARSSRAEEVKSLSVFPNPAAGFINISHQQSKISDKISIYSLSGVRMMQIEPAPGTTSTRVNIPKLNTGIYQVVYTNVQNRFSQKLIVK